VVESMVASMATLSCSILTMLLAEVVFVIGTGDCKGREALEEHERTAGRKWRERGVREGH
jgi:hypothetical protein